MASSSTQGSDNWRLYVWKHEINWVIALKLTPNVSYIIMNMNEWVINTIYIWLYIDIHVRMPKTLIIDLFFLGQFTKGVGISKSCQSSNVCKSSSHTRPIQYHLDDFNNVSSFADQTDVWNTNKKRKILGRYNCMCLQCCGDAFRSRSL